MYNSLSKLHMLVNRTTFDVETVRSFYKVTSGLSFVVIVLQEDPIKSNNAVIEGFTVSLHTLTVI